MNFLEAHKILKESKDGEKLNFLFAMSGLGGKLDVFLKATAALHGYRAEYRTLEFNTLQQTMLTPPVEDEMEVFLLFPWDLVPSTDWRSGFSVKILDEEKCYQEAQSTVENLLKRKNSKYLYAPAPIPPIFSSVEKNRNLEQFLIGLMHSLGAVFLSKNIFSLGSYLDNGCPLSGAELGHLAEMVVQEAITKPMVPCKVLVTDLDNVMWLGVIGEDGVNGIQFEPHGLGYRFFIYQTYLRKLKNEGILLAAVSRNDSELALLPFQQKNMTLKVDDFVSVIASYNAKSSQISDLAEQLNLGLDSFVFVDDNPIELEEVSQQLPSVNCVLFPANDEMMPAFFATLSAFFNQNTLTKEDAKRTELYKRRLKGFIPSDRLGSDLTGFLAGLEMELSIFDRSKGDRARAVQLINKTNQFNLNGIRVTDEEVNAILNEGGRLFTAALRDKHGEHGEILSCLIDSSGKIRSYVMSCRVFQRRIEYAFLAWLVNKEMYGKLLMHYLKTDRNEPFGKYLDSQAFIKNDSGILLDSAFIKSKYEQYVDIFKLYDE